MENILGTQGAYNFKQRRKAERTEQKKLEEKYLTHWRRMCRISSAIVAISFISSGLRAGSVLGAEVVALSAGMDAANMVCCWTV